ncbi:MAG: cell division protein FtsZ [Mycoplasmatales bacterium]
MVNYNIKVLGVGGGGSNTVDYMVKSKLKNIQSYAINTDSQALEQSKADYHLHIGKTLTKGLGAGALPEIGRAAAEESREEIKEILVDSDIVFIAAGMGGGTGTGAAPVIAEIAKSMGILTIAVVTKPFSFEGPSRLDMALNGISNLESVTDVTIVIPNEKLVQNFRDKFIEEAFELPDEILKKGVETIVTMLDTINNLDANIDLNTLRNGLRDKGLAVMGIGESNNPELSASQNSIKALENAIDSNILEISIHGAKQIIILIGGNLEYMTYDVITEVRKYLVRELGDDITIVQGLKDEADGDENFKSVTIIATGYADKEFVDKIKKVEQRISDDMIINL